MNPFNAVASPTLIPVVEMTDSLTNENNAAWRKVTPDVKHYLALDIYKINNIHFNNPQYYPVSEVDGFKKFFTPQVCFNIASVYFQFLRTEFTAPY